MKKDLLRFVKVLSVLLEYCAPVFFWKKEVLRRVCKLFYVQNEHEWPRMSTDRFKPTDSCVKS